MAHMTAPVARGASDDDGSSGAPLPHFDVDEIEALMHATARGGTSISYSAALMVLGYRFSRPKMRALCRVLDVVDQRAAARGQPELAVLVVRESDGLPGQGWWVGRRDYSGDWTGAAAHSFVRALQAAAFAFWANHA